MWAELLNPKLFVPDWCVESQKSIVGLPWRAGRTIVRTILPWRMWRGIRMTHPVRWGRLCAYLAFLLACLYVVFAISLGLYCVQETNYMTRSYALNWGAATSSATPWQVFVHACATPLSTKPTATITLGGRPGAVGAAPPITFSLNSPSGRIFDLFMSIRAPVLLLLAIPLCCALAFAALPISRRRAKVRWIHLARAMLYCYGLVWIAVVVSLIAATWRPYAVGWTFPQFIAGLFWLASPVLLIVFWWCAATLYLRMQHGFFVALSVSIIGVLTPVALTGSVWVLSD